MPISTKTPAGEEPAPGRQDTGTCNGNQREVASSPGPVLLLHSNQSPPGIQPALASQSRPALSEEEIGHLAQKFGEDLARCSTFAELDEVLRKHLPAEKKDKRMYQFIEVSPIADEIGPPPTHFAQTLRAVPPWVFFSEAPGLPTTGCSPGPEDDDLRDYDDDNDWHAFVRDSWEELLRRPVSFDIDTGEPQLVPRAEIPLAKAAGYISVGQVLSGKSSPSESE